MGQCQEKEGAERDMGGINTPPFVGGLDKEPSLLQEALPGLWQHQNCRFLAAVEVFEKSGDLTTFQRNMST